MLPQISENSDPSSTPPLAFPPLARLGSRAGREEAYADVSGAEGRLPPETSASVSANSDRHTPTQAGAGTALGRGHRCTGFQRPGSPHEPHR